MIKVYAWSHGSDCWVYFESFNSVDEANSYILNKGYDPKYFEIDTQQKKGD